jgi:adenylylsulfate kinase
MAKYQWLFKGLGLTMKVKSSNTVVPELNVLRHNREEILGYKPAVVWLTGLSASGKSTIADRMSQILFAQGINSFVLDGDLLRHGLCGDLGFDDRSRQENVRRVAEVAKLFFEAGIVAICPLISPFRKDRNFARSLIPAPYFVEVFVDCKLDVCKSRDPKGLYAKAMRDEIPHFTGISSPYEEPDAPEIHLQTHLLTPEQCTEIIWKKTSNLLRN